MSDQVEQSSIQEINHAWQRRCERIPARFGSISEYLAAVEGGLLTTEPGVSKDPPGLTTLKRAIGRAKSDGDRK